MNSPEIGDENKTKNITSLRRRISLAGRQSRERGKGEKRDWVGNKEGEAQGNEQKKKKEKKMCEVTEARKRKPGKDDGDKGR